MELEATAVKRFLKAVNEKYGHDFTDYAPNSVRRRLKHIIARNRLPSLAYLEKAVLTDERYFKSVLDGLTVHVTSMFRDPEFYRSLRKHVLPQLNTYPFVKVWHAGCSTGEEVYSMAIMLQEMGLYEKTLIYATDVNQRVLKRARSGIYPMREFKNYTTNYQQAGGQAAFSDYYTAKYDAAIMDSALKKNIVFAQHNLVKDYSFNEFNLIICRNVLIYFNRRLQSRVQQLLHTSLGRLGYLALGSKETLSCSGLTDHYRIVDKETKIYQRLER